MAETQLSLPHFPEIHLSFPRLNHFWNDAGVLGLHRCLINDVHADPQPESSETEGAYDELFNIDVTLTRDALDISGEAEAVLHALEAAYNRLVERYYNLSNEKQWAELTNFYYDRSKDRFMTFPKKKARGIAAFIYDKAPRPAGDQVKWAGKKSSGRLPEPWAHLQGRLEAFMADNHLSPGPPAGMLLDRPNQVRPNVRIAVREKKPKGVCFLCGRPSSTLEKVSQTVFPFITGDSGVLNFFPDAHEVVKVCWRCAFVGKFVPVNGFYLTAGERLHMFFPFAPSLTKMNEIYDKLKTVVYPDPNFWKNFEIQLGGYFTRAHEMAFAFMYTVYNKLFPYTQDEQATFEADLYGFAIEDAPVSLAVVTTEQKGNTQMPTEAYIFDDVTYLFRLFHEGEGHDIDWTVLSKNMVDHTAAKSEDYSLHRNRMMHQVLNKHSLLREAESFAYHVNRTNRQYITPLVQFVHFYESLLDQGGVMEKQALEAAVTLGRRVGAAVAAEHGKKGNLFALRKCRTVADFVNELNRLQFRYRVVIPPAVYEGHLTQENFDEFRGFCLLAALNTFNAGMAKAEQAEATN